MKFYVVSSDIIPGPGRGLLALASGAFLILTVFFTYSVATISGSAVETPSAAICVKHLKTVTGTIRIADERPEINCFQARNNRKQTLASVVTRLRAENYPLFTY